MVRSATSDTDMGWIRSSLGVIETCSINRRVRLSKTLQDLFSVRHKINYSLEDQCTFELSHSIAVIGFPVLALANI